MDLFIPRKDTVDGESVPLYQKTMANNLAIQNWANAQIQGVDVSGASQPLTDSVILTPVFNTVNFDSGQVFTSPSTITVPEDGVYVMYLSAYWNTLANGGGMVTDLVIIVPPTGPSWEHRHIVDPTVSSLDDMTAIGVNFLHQGTVVALQVLSSNITTANVVPHFSMYRIGRYPSKVS